MTKEWYEEHSVLEFMCFSEDSSEGQCWSWFYLLLAEAYDDL